MKKCNICNSLPQHAFTSIALKKYPFNATICPGCGILQVDNPHWLMEAYSDAIAACDTGLVARNLSLASKLNPLLLYLFGTDGRYVDFAGGTGLFVRFMRDIGYDFYWKDPYCKNIHARGFEFEQGMQYEAVTAFEVLEHIVDPIGFISNAFEETGADALIFTTTLFSGSPPRPDEWWYYAFDTGQHISFYQAKTLNTISEQLGMKFVSNSGIHIFCTANLFKRLSRYFKTSLIRQFVRYKCSRVLKSKTMTDHFLVLSQDNIPR
jgi:hypothetical protein